MSEFVELLRSPWPWYLAGPAIGAMVPLLLFTGGRRFGISSSFRHLCAATGVRADYFRYDWRREGGWNLLLVAGIVLGGALAGMLLTDPNPVAIAEATRADLTAAGLTLDDRLAPREIFSLAGLLTPAGFVAMIIGGFLVGFGARWAGGCTSGHAITGLAELQRGSLIAVAGFFAGGLVTTYAIWPWLFS